MDRALLARVENLSNFADFSLTAEPVRRLLAEVEAAQLADFLGEMLDVRVAPAACEGYLALALHLLTPGFLAYSRARELYECASAAGHEGLCAVLVAGSAPAAARPAGAGGSLPRDPLFDELPLGTRKWKARLHDPNLLARLLNDPDPSVVDILLANPRVTEDQVVRMVARRPHRPKVLAVLLRHPGWLKRPRVRNAFVANPQAPVNARVALLPLLALRELKSLAENPAGPPVFDRAVERLTR
jgi:hypothetical protein